MLNVCSGKSQITAMLGCKSFRYGRSSVVDTSGVEQPEHVAATEKGNGNSKS